MLLRRRNPTNAAPALLHGLLLRMRLHRL